MLLNFSLNDFPPIHRRQPLSTSTPTFCTISISDLKESTSKSNGGWFGFRGRTIWLSILWNKLMYDVHNQRAPINIVKLNLQKKAGIRYRMNLNNYQKIPLKNKWKSLYFITWVMKILILMSKILPPNSKTVQLKQIVPIALVSNLLLYVIVTLCYYWCIYQLCFSL